VLIHDDVLATGSTAAAKAALVEQLGGEVVGLAFLIELSGLGGRVSATTTSTPCSRTRSGRTRAAGPVPAQGGITPRRERRGAAQNAGAAARR
jgi:hypothetical protein